MKWLRGLGLERYETVFREHAIDMDVVADLTDAELAQTGAPLGDRKRLLKAIARLPKIEPSFSAKEGAPPAEVNPPATPTPAPLAAGRDAERRPVAVMFCDLVGSTNLAMRLDAEDLRNLVNAYLEEASSAVTSFGGHVLKKLGDGLMALFGYPQAEENDAERAVRAALAIQRGLGELSARDTRSGEPELAVRIGIDAGPVVVEPGGEVYGETPNIAARVQALAARARSWSPRASSVRWPACSSRRIAARMR
jgi:class 3 adenylate cyclase